MLSDDEVQYYYINLSTLPAVDFPDCNLSDSRNGGGYKFEGGKIAAVLSLI
jgi:hypothetical protein